MSEYLRKPHKNDVKFTPEVLAKMDRLSREGLGREELSQRFNVSKNNVTFYLRRYRESMQNG